MPLVSNPLKLGDSTSFLESGRKPVRCGYFHADGGYGASQEPSKFKESNSSETWTKLCLNSGAREHKNDRETQRRKLIHRGP